MKIVINGHKGGFYLTKEEMKRIGYTDREWRDVPRNDNGLVTAVELGIIDKTDDYRNLKIVTIPDNATDCGIISGGWSEYVIFVVNGKLDAVA